MTKISFPMTALYTSSNKIFQVPPWEGFRQAIERRMLIELSVTN